MASRSLGTLSLDLIARTSGFEQGMDRAARTADKRMREIEKRAKAFGTAFGAALATGATAAASGLVVLTKAAIDQADAVRDLSVQTGLSTETLSAYGFAASQTGTDIDALGKGLRALSKNIAEANDPASKAAELFRVLGVQGDDFSVVLPQIADAFRNLEDGATKAALAQELFGKSGVELTEFLNQGSEGIRELTDRAAELGLVIDSETAKAADDFNDSLGELKALSSALGLELARELLPTMRELVGELTGFATEGQKAQQAGQGIASGIRQIGQVAKDTINFVGGLREVLNGLQDQANGYTDLLLGRAGAIERIRASGGRISNAFTKPVLGGTPARAPVPGVDEIDFTQGAPLTPQERSAMEAGLRGVLGGGGGSGGARRARSVRAEVEESIDLNGALARVQRDLAEAIGEVTTKNNEAVGKWAELRAELAGPLAQAELDHIKRLQEIEQQGKAAGANAAQIAAAKAIETDAYRATTEAIKEQQAALANPELVGLLDDFRFGTADAFTDIVTGAKSAKDALRDFFDDLAANVTRAIANRWVEQLLGGFGTTGAGTSGGNVFASIFGALFGGGRATGGSVSAGSFYRVNELGPELLSVNGSDYLMMGGKMSGNVTPYRGSGGGGFAQTLNIQVEGRVDRRTANQIAVEAGLAARREIGRTR